MADGRRIPAQILQVPEAIGGRTVDILLISAGGNDVGFSDIIRGCIEINRCYEEPTIRNNLNSAFSSLPGLYDRLAADIKERFAVSNTLITEYPDPTHNSRGSFCSPTPEMVSQQDPFIEVYEDEWKWTYENVLTRLNQEVKNAR